MNSQSDSPGQNAPRGFRRVAPAFILFFLSPFVAEFLLGDFSIASFGLILAFAPMYGGGALTIREATRRLGRGWPTMVMLALAYGLLEEGVIIQTLFNPNYLGFHLLVSGWIPALGIGVWWTSFVLVLHTVWSISVPIALMEGLVPERRTTPWLGKLGFSVSALMLVVGILMILIFSLKQDHFRASALQVSVVSALIVALVLLAFFHKPWKTIPKGKAPSPWLVGGSTLVLGLAFMSANKVLQGWPLACVQVGLDALGVVGLLIWSRRTQWGPLQTLSAAGGALMTYACAAFATEPLMGPKGAIVMVSHVVFGSVALALLVGALRAQLKFAEAVSGENR